MAIFPAAISELVFRVGSDVVSAHDFNKRALFQQI
jgi:hypothetical protein